MNIYTISLKHVRIKYVNIQTILYLLFRFEQVILIINQSTKFPIVSFKSQATETVGCTVLKRVCFLWISNFEAYRDRKLYEFTVCCLSSRYSGDASL